MLPIHSNGKIGRGAKNIIIVLLLITTSLLLIMCREQKIEGTYSPQEWRDLLKTAGGWVPLPFPDSKYRPGTIIKVTDNGIRWISDLKSCNIPEEALFIKISHIPDITFSKAKEFSIAAAINFKGIEAGPEIDRDSNIRLEIQDHGADAIDLIKLEDWSRKPGNMDNVSKSCLNRLKKPDHFLVTEVFRVSKGAYTLHNKSGNKIELKAPVLNNLLQFEPKIEHTVEADGKLIIDQSVCFAVRKAELTQESINDYILGFDVKGDKDTADAMIEKLFFKAAGEQ